MNVNPFFKLQETDTFKGLKVINLNELQTFSALGKWYAESEVIYNIFLNINQFHNINHIGFVHYDMDISSITEENLIFNFTKYVHLNLESHLFETDFNQKILMDIRHPNKLTGRGKNCYYTILEDYNQFYLSNYTLNLFKGKSLNLCSAFILETSIFLEMMKFISSIITSHKLDFYDTERKNRFQGGMLERYYAVWLLINCKLSLEVKINHYYINTSAANKKSGIKRLVYKLWKKIKSV
ncbi:MAG: hypothetical protein ABI761_12685 [Saprospiraceae bacterium]